jgi:4-amino-4-deoxy-L-arabinose transferase-like glycosyltransferase
MDRGARWLASLLWPVLVVVLLLRLVLAARVELVPDEAFYWVWTRHLAPGYFDHPPMIAYLMWLSTRVLGNTELGVRLPATVLSVGAVLVLVLLARRLLRDPRATGYVLLMWLVSPLWAVLGLIFTPDTPAAFFSICAMAVAVLIADRDDREGPVTARPFTSDCDSWILFGLFSGLAMLSKYTSVLAPGGVALALLTSARGRAHLKRPWPWMAGLIALAVFSPVVYWNATHHWASFAFQLHHGASEGITEGITGVFPQLTARLLGLVSFVAGQAVVWTPILFVVALVVMLVNWRKYGGLRGADRVLLWCGTLPLVFFGWAATRSHGEINWPAFAYFPLSLLTARYLGENWAGRRVQFVREGCKVALVMMIAMHLVAVPGVTTLLARWRVPIPHSVTDLSGWRSFGRQVSERAAGARVICNRHQDAGEAAFYMPGQPDVWCEGVGSRPTAFDYFDTGRPDYARLNRVLFVGSHVKLFMEKFGYPDATPLAPILLPSPRKARAHAATMVMKSEEWGGRKEK